MGSGGVGLAMWAELHHPEVPACPVFQCEAGRGSGEECQGMADVVCQSMECQRAGLVQPVVAVGDGFHFQISGGRTHDQLPLVLTLSLI